MKKRFLTFVISCLLLAAFIGSTEAKKIDITYDAGAGLIQPAADPDSRMLAGGIDTKWALGEPDGSLKWLLALYEIEDVSDFIAVENPANSTDEAMSTNEGDEEDFSLGDELLSGYNLAGLVYGDRLLNQTADTPVAIETIPVEYSNPPTIVYTYTSTRPRKKELDPVKTPARLPVVNQIPPEFVVSSENPPIFTGPSPIPEKPGNNPLEPRPDKFELPDNSTINSPAPVPEPATMLLFSTGIAGLAFSSLRRNKNADEKKKE